MPAGAGTVPGALAARCSSPAASPDRKVAAAHRERGHRLPIPSTAHRARQTPVLSVPRTPRLHAASMQAMWRTPITTSGPAAPTIDTGREYRHHGAEHSFGRRHRRRAHKQHRRALGGYTRGRRRWRSGRGRPGTVRWRWRPSRRRHLAAAAFPGSAAGRTMGRVRSRAWGWFAGAESAVFAGGHAFATVVALDAGVDLVVGESGELVAAPFASYGHVLWGTAGSKEPRPPRERETRQPGFSLKLPDAGRPGV